MALTKTQKKKLYEFFTTHPNMSDRKIAEQFNLTNKTVGKYRKDFWSLIDKEFIDHSVKKGIHEMRRSVDHWKLLIDKLYAELETNQKAVIVVENGEKQQSFMPLEPLERLKILQMIGDLEVKIQEWGNNPEVIQIMKLMYNAQA